MENLWGKAVVVSFRPFWGPGRPRPWIVFHGYVWGRDDGVEGEELRARALVTSLGWSVNVPRGSITLPIGRQDLKVWPQSQVVVFL